MQFLTAIEFMIRFGLQLRQAASANGRLAEARWRVAGKLICLSSLLTTAKNPHKQPARMAGTVSKPSSLTAVGRNFPLDASRLAGSFYSVSIP